MEKRLKAIGIAATVFLAVTVVMCLIAGYMVRMDEAAGAGKAAADNGTVTPQVSSSVSNKDGTGSDEDEEDEATIFSVTDKGFFTWLRELTDSELKKKEEAQKVEADSALGKDVDGDAADKDSSVLNTADKANTASPDTTDSGDGEKDILKADATEIPTATPTQAPEAEKIKIAIDAAHQGKGNNEAEPIGPGSEETKAKVSWGATGVSSNKPEYELTLSIALKLKEELIKRNYDIFMIREDNDVDISESERAETANENASFVLHIHGNATEESKTKGVLAFSISESNPFCKELYAESKRLGECLTEGISSSTGASNYGVITNDNLTALNWSKIPASHIEVGYMTNPEEDELMQTEEYQDKIVIGLADGIDAYCKDIR